MLISCASDSVACWFTWFGGLHPLKTALIKKLMRLLICQAALESNGVSYEEGNSLWTIEAKLMIYDAVLLRCSLNDFKKSELMELFIDCLSKLVLHGR